MKPQPAPIRFTLDGQAVSVSAPPGRRLSHALREDQQDEGQPHPPHRQPEMPRKTTRYPAEHPPLSTAVQLPNRRVVCVQRHRPIGRRAGWRTRDWHGSIVTCTRPRWHQGRP